MIGSNSCFALLSQDVKRTPSLPRQVTGPFAFSVNTDANRRSIP